MRLCQVKDAVQRYADLLINSDSQQGPMKEPQSHTDVMTETAPPQPSLGNSPSPTTSRFDVLLPCRA
jgi:hypothetical protein